MLRQEAFGDDVTSVAAARHFVAGQLGDTFPDLEVILLLVSELATNAIHHAGSSFVVRLHTQPSSVTIEVEDGSPLPPILEVVARDRTSGRGLRLVDELASAWGIEVLAEGKRVWFEHRRE